MESGFDSSISYTPPHPSDSKTLSSCTSGSWRLTLPLSFLHFLEKLTRNTLLGIGTYSIRTLTRTISFSKEFLDRRMVALQNFLDRYGFV